MRLLCQYTHAFTRVLDATRLLTVGMTVGRPPLNMKITTVRLPAKTIERIDALVGKNRRPAFIREAVERQLEQAEKAPHADET